MIVKDLRIYTLFTLLFVACLVCAQEPATVISDYLEAKSEGKVTVNQPSALRERLIQKQTTGESAETAGDEVKTAVGYRIQVFSDNNPRTAKSQAQARERNISARFPELSVYLLYKSPSWRVRVGDFKTQGQATQVMQEIKDAFPSYASEVKVVVDKINLREK